jgi:endonuclease III
LTCATPIRLPTYSRFIQKTTYDLRLLCNGSGDPTTRLVERDDGSRLLQRATLTPHGPGALEVAISHNGASDLRWWGAGGPWLAERHLHLIARHAGAATLAPLQPHHEAVRLALRESGELYLPASNTPYHEVLAAILGQRITARQALRQWADLCQQFGDEAPGPLRLRLPPTPARLLEITSWQFHQMGIEQQRARTLRTAARYASFIDQLRERDGATARAELQRLPGIGVWTAAVAVGVSHGDADALPVGDFHVKNTVAWALEGRPRGTDEEMCRSLAPYLGQRWRVVRLLERLGWRAPRYAAKRRLIDITNM